MGAAILSGGGVGLYGSPNWANIGTGVETSADNSGTAHTAGRTLSITATVSGRAVTPGAVLTLTPIIDSVLGTPLTINANGDFTTFTHNVGTLLWFLAELAGSGGETGACTITVSGWGSNDTFNISLLV